MLNCFAPNINIVRDPRWGRGHETYGEVQPAVCLLTYCCKPEHVNAFHGSAHDFCQATIKVLSLAWCFQCTQHCAALAQDPYLTGRLATAFVRGLQGNESRYIKVRVLKIGGLQPRPVICTAVMHAAEAEAAATSSALSCSMHSLPGPHSAHACCIQVAATCKHFAAYSLEAAEGFTRQTFDAHVSERHAPRPASISGLIQLGSCRLVVCTPSRHGACWLHGQNF